jgi:hypothetical protein
MTLADNNDQNQTLAQFITEREITIASSSTENNPYMEDSDRMDNWKVRLQAKDSDGKRRTMRLYFSKGVGHEGAQPTVEEILECMASDSAGIENSQGFNDWCGEYGYDADSRRAEKTYKVCQRQAERLAKFLGRDGYEQLLWNTEHV